MAQCKYEMMEHQVSFDDGLTWTALEVIRGDLIEYESEDCPDSGSVITKWVDLDGDYICDGNKKYKKQVLYVSYNDGITWYIDFPTVYKQGEYVGVDEKYCSFKFEGHYEEVESTPTQRPTGGGGWTPSEPVIGPVVRFVGKDPLKFIACNNNPMLTSDEVRYYDSNYNLFSAKIGKCVESIGGDAFKNYRSLSSCTFEQDSQLTSIGDYAFYNCDSLTSLDIPSGVTSIGKGAFEGSTNISKINSDVDGVYNLPNNLTTIGDGAFRYCYGLTNLKIPSGSIGNSAFTSCRGLTNVTLGSGVTSIGNAAFRNSSGLTSLDIPNSVTSIGTSAFTSCSGLTSVTIGSGIESIGDYAFDYCTSLSSITIDAETPPTIQTLSFSNTNNCPIYVPCGSVEAYKSAFSPYGSRVFKKPDCPYLGEKFNAAYSNGSVYSLECGDTTQITTANTKPSGYAYTAMTSATIGDCVTSIGQNAFSGCTNLSTVTIGSGVTSIGADVFEECHSLTSIVIPSGVTSIGASVFARCSSLTSITSLATTAPSILNQTFIYVNTGGTLTVPSGSSGYDTWMQNDNYYLGLYGWTKVEQ